MVNHILSGPSMTSLTDWPQHIPALDCILGRKEICYKSPRSLTVSGPLAGLTSPMFRTSVVSPSTLPFFLLNTPPQNSPQEHPSCLSL